MGYPRLKKTEQKRRNETGGTGNDLFNSFNLFRISTERNKIFTRRNIYVRAGMDYRLNALEIIKLGEANLLIISARTERSD